MFYLLLFLSAFILIISRTAENRYFEQLRAAGSTPDRKRPGQLLFSFLSAFYTMLRIVINSCIELLIRF